MYIIISIRPNKKRLNDHSKISYCYNNCCIARGRCSLLCNSRNLLILLQEKLEGEENLTNLKCIGRSTIISRGQNWVDKHVPYNQGGTYDGYRTDCSGFVSMAWMLSKPGLTTYTMGSVSHGISKDSLAAGDAMNCASRHILLFAGWSDSSRTHYVSME